ncbi:MAG: PASTA domain-containing protein [Oscillospiraceae bacterium]|nr:PASTA domain-containing protein [Oscillospiraceae bacterium]
MILISASIVLMLASALGIIIIGRSGSNYKESLEQAEIYLENRDYDNAIAIYNKIISENKTCAEAYVGLSESYFAKDNADKALEVLEKGARNTDNDDIIMDKRTELFPDMMYASASDDDVDDDEFDEDMEDTEITAEIVPLETEIPETESAVTEVSEESVTESETTVQTTAATTVPTTAATVPTTAAPVVVTTAPPVVTVPPVTTQATTRVTTTPTTVATTTVTTTEALKDVSVPDLTRMSLDEAYEWCSKNNVILSVVGTENNSSKILSQSPAPNSTVKENSSVIVVLEE